MSRREKIEHKMSFNCLFVTKEANRGPSWCGGLTKDVDWHFVCLLSFSPIQKTYKSGPPNSTRVWKSHFELQLYYSYNLDLATRPYWLLLWNAIGLSCFFIFIFVALCLLKMLLAKIWFAHLYDRKEWVYHISLVEFFPPKIDLMRGESYLHC